MSPIEPQSVDAIAARILRDYRNDRIGLLAPLVVNRKGYYTDLAKWAAGKGYTHLRVDGEFIPTSPWPRLARFQEHTIELPVADLRVTPENEAALRAASPPRSNTARAIVQVLGGLDTLADAMAKKDARRTRLTEAVYSVKRACPSCDRSFPELDPRLFSYNSKHGWCPACFGTGLTLEKVEWDEEREKTGTEEHVLDSWLNWLEIDEPCPTCDGQRLNPTALAVRYRKRSIAALAALPVATLAREFTDVSLQRPRGGHRPRHRRRDPQPAALPATRSASATSRSTAPRRRCRAAKRSASGSPRSSAPTCAASPTSSTSRPSACIRATTASCSTRWPSCRPRAIP